MPESSRPIARMRQTTFVILLALIFTSANGAFAAFAANPAADIDQCANGGVGDPPQTCATNNWVNGNINESKAHYFEGDFVPYRLRFTSLATTGTHTVVIEWDTTKSGKHALDYLGTYNATETTADPCSGVSGCSASTSFAVPVDPNAVNQGAGSFTLFGGTVTSASAYTQSGTYAGDSSTRITLTFTAAVANPVLAWGGHIASRADWGQSNSAVSISGSPYHMRLIDLDGSGGNQDRSLSAGAVIFPAILTIVKNTSGADGTFSYTSTGGLPAPADGAGSFSITTAGATGSAAFSITTFGAYTVTEAAAPTYSLTGLTCSPTGTATVGTRTASVTLAEGTNTTCTFINTLQTTQDVSILKTAQAGTVNAGSPAAYDITVTASGNGGSTAVTLTDDLSATGLSWGVSGIDAAACSPNPVTGNLTCAFGTLASGASKTITLTATTTAANCANGLSNTATVSAAGDTNTNNDSSGPVVIAVVCQPDVSIAKSGNGPLNAGATATFSITVTSSGTGPSSNVSLTDALPSGAWTLGGADAASCGIAAGTLTCGFGSMASGTSKTVTLSRATSVEDCPAIDNTAAVAATGDTNTENNSSTASITVNCGQITLVKTADDDSVTAGDTIGFVIAVANLGDGTATTVIVNDTLPAGSGLAWTVDAAASDDGCAITSGVLACDFGDLEPGASRLVHVTSPTTAEQCGTLRNVATADTDNDGDAEAGASIVIACQPDVSVTKTGNGPLTTGTTATFTITTSAAGPGSSNNVTLTDTLPAGTWTLGGTDAAGCALVTTSLSCTFGTMASGTSKTITLSRASTTGDCSAPIANTATLNATADANLQNNTSNASITVTCPPSPQTPQLVVSKTADATLVTAGAQSTAHVGFTVTLTNTGLISTTAVLTDTPLVSAGPSTPPGNAGTLGLTWAIDVAGSDAGCSIAANTLSCTFETLLPGASKHVHITAVVAGRTAAASRADNCGQLVDNVAIVTMGNGRSVQSNHATVNIVCLPSSSAGALTITKYADNNANARRDPGEAALAGWTFDIRNDATGAVRTATTDVNGSVTVIDLHSGYYTVTEKACASPCDVTRWKPISYVVGGQATVSSRMGSAQISLTASEKSIAFGNQPPLLPSTSTDTDDRDRIQILVLLLVAALVAQVVILRVVASMEERDIGNNLT